MTRVDKVVGEGREGGREGDGEMDRGRGRV